MDNAGTYPLQDNNLRAPEIIPSQQGRVDAIKVLLEAGAAVDGADDDETFPLIFASEKQSKYSWRAEQPSTGLMVTGAPPC